MAVGIEFVFSVLQGFFQAWQFFADEGQTAGCDLDVAFAVLRNVVVGNAVEDDAGTFRVGAGKGKVDDGAGFTFADDRQFVLDVFDGADARELGQRKFLTRIGQDLINFEGGLIVDFQRYADLAFDHAFVRQGKGIGFVALGGQREGFVEPFVLYGKAADGQFGVGVAADVVHQAADNGCIFGFDFLVQLKVVNGFTQYQA